MEWFGKISLIIRNLKLKVALHHMVVALRSGPFANDLCMASVASWDELRQHAAKFMQLE